MLTDIDGEAVWKGDCAPFGETLEVQPVNWGNPNTFLGNEDDGGIMDFGARFYDARIGRFYAPDPIKSAGSANGCNPYTYCRNNPLRYTDKNGMKERGINLNAKGLDWALSGGGWGSGDIYKPRGADMIGADNLPDMLYNAEWMYTLGLSGYDPSRHTQGAARSAMQCQAGGGNPDPTLVIASDKFISGCLYDANNPPNVENGFGSKAEWQQFRQAGIAWASQSGDRFGYDEFVSGPSCTEANFEQAIINAKTQAGCERADRIFAFLHGAGSHLLDARNGMPMGPNAGYVDAAVLINAAKDHLVPGGFLYVWACLQDTAKWNAVAADLGCDIHVVILPRDNVKLNPLAWWGDKTTYWNNIKLFEQNFQRSGSH